MEFCGNKNAQYIQQVYQAALAERAHPRVLIEDTMDGAARKAAELASGN